MSLLQITYRAYANTARLLGVGPLRYQVDKTFSDLAPFQQRMITRRCLLGPGNSYVFQNTPRFRALAERGKLAPGVFHRLNQSSPFDARFISQGFWARHILFWRRA